MNIRKMQARVIELYELAADAAVEGNMVSANEFIKAAEKLEAEIAKFIPVFKDEL
jgi:hypothetical protein